MITLGDKLSNIRAMYRDYLVLGDELWNRFNQKDPKQHHWYYQGIAACLIELQEYPAYQEYCELVKKVFG
jgi:myo-inositol-1(or 4)-monophosphatase